jgi:hypothetical protein
VHQLAQATGRYVFLADSGGVSRAVTLGCREEFFCFTFNFSQTVTGGSGLGHGGNTFHKSPERLATMSLPQLEAARKRPQLFIYHAITKLAGVFLRCKDGCKWQVDCSTGDELQPVA